MSVVDERQRVASSSRRSVASGCRSAAINRYVGSCSIGATLHVAGDVQHACPAFPATCVACRRGTRATAAPGPAARRASPRAAGRSRCPPSAATAPLSMSIGPGSCAHRVQRRPARRDRARPTRAAPGSDARAALTTTSTREHARGRDADERRSWRCAPRAGASGAGATPVQRIASHATAPATHAQRSKYGYGMPTMRDAAIHVASASTIASEHSASASAIAAAGREHGDDARAGSTRSGSRFALGTSAPPSAMLLVRAHPRCRDRELRRDEARTLREAASPHATRSRSPRSRGGCRRSMSRPARSAGATRRGRRPSAIAIVRTRGGDRRRGVCAASTTTHANANPTSATAAGAAPMCVCATKLASTTVATSAHRLPVDRSPRAAPPPRAAGGRSRTGSTGRAGPTRRARARASP